MNANEPKHPFEGAPVIIAYTRADAIEDGVLVDVSHVAKDAGFKFHTVLTIGAWEECVAWRGGPEQDEKGRLWDLLNVARNAMRAAKPGQDRANFKVSVLKPVANGDKYGIAHDVDLYAHIGPGDTAEPVITIMLIGED